MTLKLTYAGFNYVADIDGSYTSADSLSTMIAQTASNSVALTDDFGINASTSTVYGDYNTQTTTGNTETTAALTATIKEAEQKGLSVIVRPLIDFTADASTTTLTSSSGNVYADGDWRAYYMPTNTTTFFDSYDTMIVAEARAAQAGGAQIFDIGTEIDQLTGPQYLSQWTKIINDVKAVYTGKLTYSAISDDDLSPWQYGPTNTSPPAGTGNITTQVSFWSQLDYVGIDEYAALSNVDSDNGGTDPTVAQLVQAWETPFTDDGQGTPTDATADMTGGLSLIQYYENVSTTLGKPLLFTEIGFNSAPDAASQPFYTSSSTYDPTLQANLYTAFIQAWKAQGNTSLQGVYIWNWEPNAATVGDPEAGSNPPVYDPSWTPQNNTGSLQAVDAAFTAAETPACYTPGTLIAVPGGELPVEQLAIGDTVLTHAGLARRIKWIGRRSYGARFVAANPQLLPIRIAAGALGGGLPRRELRVSPRHAMFIDGFLIPAEALVTGVVIAPDTGHRGDLHYIHIELDSHDVLLAEGAPSETFLDDDSRGVFHNAHDFTERYPDDDGAGRFCAPHLEFGYALEAIRERLRRPIPIAA